MTQMLKRKSFEITNNFICLNSRTTNQSNIFAINICCYIRLNFILEYDNYYPLKTSYFNGHGYLHQKLQCYIHKGLTNKACSNASLLNCLLFNRVSICMFEDKRKWYFCRAYNLGKLIKFVLTIHHFSHTHTSGYGHSLFQRNEWLRLGR